MVKQPAEATTFRCDECQGNDLPCILIVVDTTRDIDHPENCPANGNARWTVSDGLHALMAALFLRYREEGKS